MTIEVDWENPPAEVDYFRLTHTDPAGQEEEQNVQPSQEARTKHTIVGESWNINLREEMLLMLATASPIWAGQADWGIHQAKVFYWCDGQHLSHHVLLCAAFFSWLSFPDLLRIEAKMCFQSCCVLQFFK